MSRNIVILLVAFQSATTHAQETIANTCQLAKLIEPHFGNQFGWTVSAHEDRVAIGAFTNRAYVFRRQDHNWMLEAQLDAPIPIPGLSGFGRSVSLWGNHLAVGADSENNNTGAVYVYTRSDTTWIMQARIEASDAHPDSAFGRSVSLHDGLLLVGASIDQSDQGTAYIFRSVGGSWHEEAKLIAEDGEASDRFGEMVAIDSDTAVACAYRDVVEGGATGSCYLFHFDGVSWGPLQKVISPDGQAGEYFGLSVAIRDGMLLVGGPGHDSNFDQLAEGAAYVFTRGVSEWHFAQKLTGSDPVSSSFGSSLSVSQSFAVVGAHRHHVGMDEHGAAFFYSRAGNSISGLGQVIAADGGLGDNFGLGTALGEDYVAIGAPASDRGGINEVGSVYIFALGGADCDSNGLPDICQIDTDGDEIPDACDVCDGFDDTMDYDLDGIPDRCDPCPFDNLNDIDGDGICTGTDNCPAVFNSNQADSDADGVGNACDGCPFDRTKTTPEVCGCGVPDQGDDDGDGVLNCIDQCPGLDDGEFAPSCIVTIPTVTGWGLVIISLGVLIVAKVDQFRSYVRTGEGF